MEPQRCVTAGPSEDDVALWSVYSGIFFSVQSHLSLGGVMIHQSEYPKCLSVCLLIVSLEKEFMSHVFTSSYIFIISLYFIISCVYEKPVQAGPTSRGPLYFTEIEPATRTSLEQTSWLALRSASGFQLCTHALSGLQRRMAEASGML